MAMYDLRLTVDEFWDLTPGMFQALCKRRNIRIRYERYANALTASAVYNVNRGSNDDPTVSAFDFIRPEQDAIRLQKIREAHQHIKKVIGQMPMTTPRIKLLNVRRKVIVDLKASGYVDGEEMFNTVWPHLSQPTQDEEAQLKAIEEAELKEVANCPK